MLWLYLGCLVISIIILACALVIEKIDAGS
jgi:hypothetical protein